MNHVVTYKKYRQLGKEYLSRSTVWRVKMKRKREEEQEAAGARKKQDTSIHNSCSEPMYGPTPKPRSFANNLDFEATAEARQADPIDYDLQEILEKNVNNANNNSNHNNLLDLIQSDGFFEPINYTVRRSRADVFFMLIEYCKKNNSSKAAVSNLFKLINVLFPEAILPDSQYKLDKILNEASSAELHAICHKCTAYVGKFTEIRDDQQTCYNCEAKLDIHNPSKHSYFVLINPSVQLSDLLHIHKTYYESVLSNDRVRDGVIRDVYDGQMYTKFLNSLSPEERNAYCSLCLNTDGAEKYSRVSVWPIYLQINELPPQERINNLVTCGLWFHKKKPNMSVFLDPFVDMMKEVSFNMNVNNESRIIKAHVISCCVDSSARPGMQGVKQFNGFTGCNWCIHPGEYFAGSVRYPIKLNVEARTHENTLRIMTEEDLSVPVDGIKQPSPLINCSHFDLIRGFLVDYFHAVLEGAAEQIYEYFFNMMDSSDIAELDEVIMKISLPKQVSKLTKEISKRKDWSAREKENFILFNSLPLFELKIPEKYCKYWKLLVDALYILLKQEVTVDEIDIADEKLHKFVATTHLLFEETAMTFNVHQLLHLSQCVLDWGPLWSHSCYGFEAANQQILHAITNARGAPHQVVRWVNFNHSALVVREHVMKSVSPIVKIYCENTLGCRIARCYKINNHTYFGKKKEIGEDIRSDFNLSTHSYKFFKVIKNNCLFARLARDNLRSDNSCAMLKNGKFFKIEYFLVDLDKKIEILCGYFIETSNIPQMNENYRIVRSISHHLDQIHTSDLENVCVLVKIDKNHTFITTVPNRFHYN